MSFQTSAGTRGLAESSSINSFSIGAAEGKMFLAYLKLKIDTIIIDGSGRSASTTVPTEVMRKLCKIGRRVKKAMKSVSRSGTDKYEMILNFDMSCNAQAATYAYLLDVPAGKTLWMRHSDVPIAIVERFDQAIKDEEGSSAEDNLRYEEDSDREQYDNDEEDSDEETEDQNFDGETEMTDGAEAVASTDSSNFQLGRYVMRNGTLLDQETKIPLRLHHRKTGELRTYQPQIPITDWNDSTQISRLNNWHRQAWHRASGRLDHTGNPKAWSIEEKTFIRSLLAAHPGLKTLTALKLMNRHFAGRSVTVDEKPVPFGRRKLKELVSAIQTFNLNQHGATSQAMASHDTPASISGGSWSPSSSNT